MYKIYVASLNKAKVDAVKEVLNSYEVIGMKVNSFVNNQPLSDAETILGAKNRAMQLPKDGLRIGLEAGVQMHDDIMFLVNWGVLIDFDDIIYYAGGTRIPLPNFIKDELLKGEKELADVMAEYTKINDIRFNQGAIGYFTHNQVPRKDIFVHIVKLLYGQYLKKE